MKSKNKKLPTTNYQLLTSTGFSLVEAILASAIFGLLVTALVGSYLYGQEATVLAGNRARAVMLAEGALEATRNIKEKDFTNLTNGTFGLAVLGNEWVLSGSSDATDIFTRQIVVSSVDANRKSLTTNVSWQQNAQRAGQVSLITYLTNWQRVASLVGNWSNATTTSSLNFAGVNDGRKIAIAGDYAYVVRTDGVPDFLVINISNPNSPTLMGSLSLAGIPTNIAIAGNYAYVSNTNDAQELQIINISNPALPSVTGVFNAAGTTDANGVFVNGTTAYLVRVSGTPNEFMIINTSAPSTPTLVGSLNLGATGYEVAMVGNTAYVASGSNSQELQVLNITNPATPTILGGFNLAGTIDAITLTAFSNTVVIGQGNNLSTINVTTPTLPTLLGALSLGGTVNDISLGASNTYAFTATANIANEFQIINIATLTTPVLLGGINLTGSVILLGVAYDAVQDIVGVVGNSDAQEFFIFSPQ